MKFAAMINIGYRQGRGDEHVICVRDNGAVVLKDHGQNTDRR
jgi:hypothetical protein